MIDPFFGLDTHPTKDEAQVAAWRRAMTWARENRSWALLNAMGEGGPEDFVDYDELIATGEARRASKA